MRVSEIRVKRIRVNQGLGVIKREERDIKVKVTTWIGHNILQLHKRRHFTALISGTIRHRWAPISPISIFICMTRPVSQEILKNRAKVQAMKITRIVEADLVTAVVAFFTACKE